MTNPTAALILAAGQGKRMQSETPKVLHTCAELPLICHVIRLAQASGCAPIVVVVSPSNQAAIAAVVQDHFPGAPIMFAVQHKPCGTGDAARAGLASLPHIGGDVAILYGDVPLLQPRTLAHLQQGRDAAALTLLSANPPDARGYGRVVRDSDGAVKAIVEDRDCTEAQARIVEVNAGVYVCGAALLQQALAGLSPKNAQHEYYLTDIVAYAAAHGGARAVVLDDVDEMRGVNSRLDLHGAERALQRKLFAQHAAAGVAFRDMAGTFVGVDVVVESDVMVGMGVQLYGKTIVRRGAILEGPSVLRDSHIGPDCVVHAFCHLEGARMEAGATIGPYARLRPQAHLMAGAKVGNFVEIKKATLCEGAKANHLAYIGDTTVGTRSNIGAGTITCNYDGFNKHQTTIGADVFVGSNSTLVAPLTLHAGAFVAAGSVIVKEVPAQALALGRAVQVNKPDYAQALRQRLLSQKNSNQKKVT